MNKYFPNANSVKFDKLKISDVGKYSISKPSDSEVIIEIISKYFKNKTELKTLTITDATANNGGDTIRFAMNFKCVNSIEINESEFNILEHNIKLYGFKNVKLFNKDFTSVIPTIKQDVIYVDAPWGGVNYKTKMFVDLFISNVNLIDIVNDYYNKKYFKLMILKVPKNYNFIKLFRSSGMIYHIHTMKSMNIIVLLAKK
jgi:hypothetical protein